MRNLKLVVWFGTCCCGESPLEKKDDQRIAGRKPDNFKHFEWDIDVGQDHFQNGEKYWVFYSFRYFVMDAKDYIAFMYTNDHFYDYRSP